MIGRNISKHFVSVGRGLVDCNRMGIGGFCAGAFASAYGAYARGLDAAAVICLSGGMEPDDAEHDVRSGLGLPPMLLFEGEDDLP